jgi:hypothetical protein
MEDWEIFIVAVIVLTVGYVYWRLLGPRRKKRDPEK